jgi:hypothetical protein
MIILIKNNLILIKEVILIKSVIIYCLNCIRRDRNNFVF